MRMTSPSWASSRSWPICRASCACGAGCAASSWTGSPTPSSASTPPVCRASRRTVQYVSPQVWAWRERGVQRIAAACDLVLCLLPFEPPFYARHGAQAQFVGHPLADQIPLGLDRAAARRTLGLGAQSTVVALLPGSRAGEVSRLGPDFIAAPTALATRQPRVEFIPPMASARTRTPFSAQLAAAGHGRIRLLEGQAGPALEGADAALVSPGTCI